MLHQSWVSINNRLDNDMTAKRRIVAFEIGTFFTRHVVVAVAGDAAQLGVLVEGIAVAGVGDQGEEVLVAEVVDPR